jgi:hypothetical protein
MKQILRKLFRNILQIEIVWKLFLPIVKAGNFLQYQKNYYHHQKEREPFERLKAYLQSPIVRNGPFKNLKYPDFVSYGSAIFPKIIGSYEAELHPVIEELCKKEYSQVINIGSGEGYYAVGLAKRIPNAIIYAYELLPEARKFIKQMAELNGMANRIVIQGKCTKEELIKFPFSNRALIICDCEGAEKEIFDEQVVKHILKCDLIIEVHDFVDITISDYLTNLFQETHSIERIPSIDDLIKARTYAYPEIESLDLQTKHFVLSEKRPTRMEWFVLRAKSYNQ